jgi:hypothetical protein
VKAGFESCSKSSKEVHISLGYQPHRAQREKRESFGERNVPISEVEQLNSLTEYMISSWSPDDASKLEQQVTMLPPDAAPKKADGSKALIKSTMCRKPHAPTQFKLNSYEIRTKQQA